MSPPPLDLNRLSLEPGVRLLEASAGTGKTFALAHLVLRLVGETGIGLRRLLVVTFTRAATAELRDRIGSRLQQALAGLEPPPPAADGPPLAPPPTPDPVLTAWLEQRIREGASAGQELRGRLLLALEELDAADITTIHGYAGRCLRRWALEAGQPPDLQLESDPSALITEVVHDYWQQQVLPLGPGPLAALRGRRIEPALLARLLTALDADPALALAPPPTDLQLDAPLPPQWPGLWQGLLRRFRNEWQARGAQLEADLCAMAAQWRADGVDPKPYAARPRRRRGDAVDSLLQRPEGDLDAEQLLAVKELQDYFHPGAIAQVARRAEGADSEPSLPQRPLLLALADLLDGPAERLLRHGLHWGLGELERRRQRLGRCGYAQLLAALDPGPEAEGPTPLLAAMAGDHDVALIDEFQDTDPVQWRLLRLTFGLGHHRLLMVGDPKQAIYRFRGGDLATYLAAAAVATERLVLDENHRSRAALIDGLNGLMGPAGLPRSGLPVPAVRARSRRRGPDGAPVQLLWLGGDRPAGDRPVSRTAVEQELPALVARHLQVMLEEAPPLDHGDGPVPLRPADVCLLVGTHQQAEALRAALERQAIPSRLVSQADVLASPAATALQRLLDALADPADANRLRLLAASPLLAWESSTLAAAAPERWSSLAGLLQRLAADLPQLGLQGVLARLIDADGLARLAGSGRLLADLQQVAQLLQERLHADPLGAAATADWLRRLRLDPNRRISEERRAHSEQADDAVAVMTVHASKGLEFPVVLCPYLSLAAAGAPSGPGLRWQPAGEGPRLDLHLSPHWGEGRAAAVAAAAAEAAERERLAYVAVTRAAHLLVLAWGPVRGQAESHWSPWLFGRAIDEQELQACGDAEWLQRLGQAIEGRQLPL
ncbi:MAG: UvrD-helicase domain-containing protein, partial [Prochlorococcaceae cyanobacterium]